MRECKMGQCVRECKSVALSADDEYAYFGSVSGDVLKVSLRTALFKAAGPKRPFSKVRVCARAHTHVHACAHESVHTHTRVHAHARPHSPAHTYARTGTRARACARAVLPFLLHTHTHTNTRTHAHTNTRMS